MSSLAPQCITGEELYMLAKAWVDVTLLESNQSRSDFWEEVQRNCASKGVYRSISSIRTTWSTIVRHVEIYRSVLKEIQQSTRSDKNVDKSRKERQILEKYIKYTKPFASATISKKLLTPVRYLISERTFMEDERVIRSLERFRSTRTTSNVKIEAIPTSQLALIRYKAEKPKHGPSVRDAGISKPSPEISRTRCNSREAGSNFHKQALKATKLTANMLESHSDSRNDLSAPVQKIFDSLRMAIENYTSVLEKELDLKLIEIMPDSRERDQFCIDVLEERRALLQRRKAQQNQDNVRTLSTQSNDSDPDV